MSALTDYFTSLANKIRAKVGGSQTYTPTQMVSAIDDVYAAGAASVPSPASITPSNASPVALTANAAVKPTANGYAIESYNSVTPSTNMPSLTAGNIYKPTANGYAVSTFTTITPSDSNPPALTGGAVYRVQSGESGYAYSTKPDPAPDFFDVKFASANTLTYTFDRDLDYVYLSSSRTTNSDFGTYTGSGTVTKVKYVINEMIIKITGVKSGDKYVTPTYSNRANLSVIGKEA